MARLAVEGDDLFEVSDCELQREEPSFTLDTVRHFRRLYPEDIKLYWLIGADSLPELAGWHEVKQLVDECTIVTVARPGFETGDLAKMDSARIRVGLLALLERRIRIESFQVGCWATARSAST